MSERMQADRILSEVPCFPYCDQQLKATDQAGLPNDIHLPSASPGFIIDRALTTAVGNPVLGFITRHHDPAYI